MKILYWFAIKFYQHFISPRKGFACAYRKVHRGTGCSGAVLEILMQKGFIHGRNDILKRFDDCHKANNKLSEEKKDKKDKKEDACSDTGCDCLPDIGECGCNFGLKKLKGCNPLNDLSPGDCAGDCVGGCGGISLKTLKFLTKK